MFTIRYALCAVFTLAGLHASAGVINNGDFSSLTPLDGFSPTGNVSEPTDDFALFDDSGFLTQTFTIPSSASTLSFDFAFSTSNPSGTSTGFDSFSVELTTNADLDILDILVVDYEVEVSPDPLGPFGLPFPPFVPIDVSYVPSASFPGFQGVTGETKAFYGKISLTLPDEVLGELATITFDLGNQDPGAQTLAALDNLAVTTNNPIPEPSSFALWLGATAVMLGSSTRRRRKAVAADSK